MSRCHHTTTPPHATRRATRIQRPKPVYNFRLARLRRRLRRRVELFITSGVRVRKRVCSGTREILPLTGTHCRCRARSRVHANNRACKYLFYPPLVDSARAVCCNTKKTKQNNEQIRGGNLNNYSLRATKNGRPPTALRIPKFLVI